MSPLTWALAAAAVVLFLIAPWLAVPGHEHGFTAAGATLADAFVLLCAVVGLCIYGDVRKR